MRWTRVGPSTAGKRRMPRTASSAAADHQIDVSRADPGQGGDQDQLLRALQQIDRRLPAARLQVEEPTMQPVRARQDLQRVCPHQLSRRSRHGVPHLEMRVSNPQPSQCRSFVDGDMIGLVALNLVLRIVLARAMGVAFVIKVRGADPYDRATDLTSLRVPCHVITELKSFGHDAASPFRGSARSVSRGGERYRRT